MIFRYNPYELIYMYRTGDAAALKMLAEAYGGFLNTIVEQTLNSSPEFAGDREDLFQECLLALHDALECYRDDMDSSFSTFVTVLARRRIWRFLRPRLRRMYDAGIRDINLEDVVAVNEPQCWYDVIAQQQKMNEPEFFMEYTVLRDKLDQMFLKMKQEDQQILYAWIQGEDYKSVCERLGVSPKAYYRRMDRLRARVKKAGNPERAERMA